MSQPKCLQTEKSVPLRNIDKLFNPNLEPCHMLYHSRSRLDLTIMMMKGSFYSPLPKSLTAPAHGQLQYPALNRLKKVNFKQKRFGTNHYGNH